MRRRASGSEQFGPSFMTQEGIPGVLTIAVKGPRAELQCRLRVSDALHHPASVEPMRLL